MYTTRIAPSPTGIAHIGTMRTAYFNWLAARASGGRFILRIDDTDAERNQPEAVQPIFDGLSWLGLDPDEVHYQSQRGDLYRDHAERLLATGLATRADNGAILLRLPGDLPATWTDSIKGEIAISDRDREVIDGLPLLRGGDHLGSPTYQFASILDDWLMGVSYILRGTDHISNTAKQVAIWTALTALTGEDRPLPRFSHIGLIHKNKQKLSKRHGAASVLDYREAGYDPDGLLNFLLRLGWGPKVDDAASTFMTRDQAKELFLDQGNLRAAPANFDDTKLTFYDRRYKQRKFREAKEALAE
jgi:glutamyl-tRNA synthetase